MALELRRVVVLTGPYGSGKTELAIGLSLHIASQKRGRVALADVDVLKPYFRSREAMDPLRAAGVQLIAPEGALGRADLPILPAELRGSIPLEDVRLVLDVGGDPVGARALGSISDVVSAADHDMLLVLNKYRPFMDNLDEVMQTAEQIQQASHLRVTGVVANTHMMEHTTMADVQVGIALAREVASHLGVSVCMVAVPEHLEDDAKELSDQLPVMVIRRFMRPTFLGGVVLAEGVRQASARARSEG